MLQISSHQTKYIKVAVPLIAAVSLIGAAVVFAVNTECGFGIEGCIFGFPFLALIPLLMLLPLVLLVTLRLLPLADEVWCDGANILVKHQGRSLHIPLTDIVGLGYEHKAQHQAHGGNSFATVTLLLRENTVLGKKIPFILCQNTSTKSERATAEALIDRFRTGNSINQSI